VQNISLLENAHLGEDIFVVGAGKSNDYTMKSILDDRISIGVNNVWVKYENLTYNMYKDTPYPESGLDIPVIVSKYRCGSYPMGENNEHVKGNEFYFDHNNNTLTDIDFTGLHPHGDKLAVSFSTITSAIHLAAFMGARAVFLIGHDCAPIQGHNKMDNYPQCNIMENESDYKLFVKKIIPQTVIMRDYLEKEYGIPLISLSPFIGLKNEGMADD
jgi:hypothetical protein